MKIPSPSELMPTLSQYIAKRRLSELAFGLLFGAVLIRVVCQITGIDNISSALMGLLVLGIFWLRLSSAGGMESAREEISQGWAKASDWLALTNWGRLLAFCLVTLVALSVLSDALFGSSSYHSALVGLLFALIAAKIAGGVKTSDAPNAASSTTNAATNTTTAPVQTTPKPSLFSRVASLDWWKLILLGILILLAAAITDEAIGPRPHKTRTHTQVAISTNKPDSAQSGVAEKSKGLHLNIANKHKLDLDINEKGLVIQQKDKNGNIQKSIIVNDKGFETITSEQSVPDVAQSAQNASNSAVAKAIGKAASSDPAADADTENSSPEDVDTDEDKATASAKTIVENDESTDEDRRAGFSFASLAMITILSMIAIKVLAGGKHRAEQEADSARTTALVAKLAREASDAKLSAMQAQIEPHFLFNTLASVDQLIQSDPQRASKVQKSLIQYLRGAIPQIRDDAQRSTLGRQADMSLAYLEIMQVRMEERLHHEVHLSEGLRSAEFPSMMLQTLIENAIKHGLEPKPEGGSLIVHAEVARGKLLVRVEDTGMGYDEQAAAQGVGLANIRERLQLMYGLQAYFKLKAREGGGAIAEIAIPYRDYTDTETHTPNPEKPV